MVLVGGDIHFGLGVKGEGVFGGRRWKDQAKQRRDSRKRRHEKKNKKVQEKKKTWWSHHPHAKKKLNGTLPPP